ncbi:Putative transposase%2C YhgA-like [Chlamydia trachomatis]|nr:Putative transposase%2C YhgA-like [Chlamydia trachomatis]
MKPDIQLKKFFEHDDRFLSLFNAYFYQGESVLKEEYLSQDDSEVVKLVASNHIDVIRRYKENEYFTLFVLENQSKVDYGMVVRIMKYQVLLYERELRKASPNNYTPKGTKLPMVRAIVLYTGEKEWDGARKLSDMILDENGQKIELDPIEDFSLNLIELNKDVSYNLNNQCVQDFIDLVHQLYDKSIHLGDMDRVYQRDAVQAAYSITKDEQLKLILEQEEGGVKVCEAMRELFEDATNKGIALGETKAFMASINSIMIKFNLNADQAMDALSIDEKDRDFYREKLASLSKN